MSHGGTVFGVADVALPTAAEAAAADIAAHDAGIPGRLLMENAGRAAALVLHRLHPHGRIIAVAGSGNNGGDAIVMARTLRTWSRDCAVIAVGSRAPDASLTHNADLQIISASADAHAYLDRADVIVDGMLGTGAEGAPRAQIAEWIRRVNATSRPIIALDLPSGVDATSGRVHDDHVRAETTICFGWPKLGLLLEPARSACGRLVAVEIGFPPHVVRAHAAAITPAWVRSRLRPRGPNAHKSSSGRLLVVAGSSGMAGAAALATEGAMRAGAGLLRVASSADNREILQTLVPEATFIDRAQLDSADVSSMHALVVGPGLGKDEEASNALDRVLSLMPTCPALLDADALNILADTPDSLRGIALARDLVITPHPKELSRLTSATVEEILADPVGAARAAAESFGCTVLLKGQPSLVARTDGHVLVGTTGTSDVATAGMGDQLAGAIGAFLAAGHDTVTAAALALFLCGRAAGIAARGRSLSPRDVSRHLADAIADPGPSASPLELPFVTFDQAPRR